MTQTLEIIAVAIVFTCALFNLVRRQWLANLVALAFQYVGVFLVLLSIRPVAVAFIPLLVGLMTTLILVVTLVGSGRLEKQRFLERISAGEVFRTIAGLVAIVLIALLVPTVRREIFPGTGSYLLFGSLGLIMLSLLQLGMKSEPLYITLGLLSFISGFQLLYASLETSALLVALFVVLNLGLGLVGAFFLVKQEDTSP
ncbi:MAG: hypothetical protein WBI14_06060 [Anaerolineaceae bacterium]